MKPPVLKPAIYVLELLFEVGVLGAALVVVLVAIDDVREVIKKEKPPA